MLYASTTVHTDGPSLDRFLDALQAKYAGFRTESTAMPDATRALNAGQVAVLELTPTEPPGTWANAKLRLG